MLRHETEDEFLSALTGIDVPAPGQAQVSYRLSRFIAKGGSAAAFLAVRSSPTLSTPVVFKVVRPTILENRGSPAALSVMKEVVALGRLNDRVPPTPHVVRLIDSGSLEVRFGEAMLMLPWVALEHVHGGAEGTTLQERLAFSVERTQFAFDAERAAVAIHCIGSGLTAVHEAGVLHRDVTLRNVLCSGFGEDEVFKLADFGLARPTGIDATFGAVSIGTPGYAAPEQMFGETNRIGPWTDVFGMACVAYALLTGQDYFSGANDLATMMATRKPERKKLTDSQHLCMELRERPSDARAVDEVLARATSMAVEQRHPSPRSLEDALLPLLRTHSFRSNPSARHIGSIVASTDHVPHERWVFNECCPAAPGRAVRHAAWDGASRCVAATALGVEYWSGTEWSPIPAEGLPADGPQFVQRLSNGDWLVAGEGSLIHLGTGGSTATVPLPVPGAHLEITDGDIDDIAIAIASTDAGPPVLHAMVGTHWLKGLPAHGVATISAISRTSDEEWLVAGRTVDDKGFAALYAPLAWELRMLRTFSTRATLACASQRHRKLAVVAGTDGMVAILNDGQLYESQIPRAPNFSAAAIDITGRVWVGAAGQLWSTVGKQWECLWRDDDSAPVRSIFAESGLVVVMTVEGRIVAGRME